MISSWMSRSSSSPAGFVDKKKVVVELGAAFSLLENHWKQAQAVMNNPNSQVLIEYLFTPQICKCSCFYCTNFINLYCYTDSFRCIDRHFSSQSNGVFS